MLRVNLPCVFGVLIWLNLVSGPRRQVAGTAADLREIVGVKYTMKRAQGLLQDEESRFKKQELA